MGLISLEHSRAAYRADFALYGSAVVGLAASLLWWAPASVATAMAACVAGGLALWTVLEYVLHRFVLHGVPPFRDWHGEHHHRPRALICAPTVFSAALIAVLVCLPAWWVAGPWLGGSVSLGVLAGYLAYAVTHHATHHWRLDVAGLRQRKRWHALHHHRVGPGAHYGVTTAFWDHVFGTAGAPRSAEPAPAQVR